ncbi:MAG: excinuclease ABC subunit UvrB [Phycisphaerales bacterium]|nr:excinuclease ABC subunit UvrB [Phycisphaerales bacterium]
MPFDLVSPFQPMGDQPTAIAELTRGVEEGRRNQVLLGATGTGKTFTIANVIANTGRPTLLVSHNKTLAAQLYEEMKELFPNNAVSYFVSFYDYYQPEAYIPARDIYIEKETQRNDDLDRLRLAATSNLVSREDCIVVASVSCLYGLGSPEEFRSRVVMLERGMRLERRNFFLQLTAMQYTRNDIDPTRGTFRVRGDCIEIYPASEKHAIRLDLFGDELESIQLFAPLTGEHLADETRTFIFPAVHYVMPAERKLAALTSIRTELDARVLELRSEGKLLEAQRLIARTRHDLEMLAEVGFCNGIENYSRHFDGRAAGERAWTLLDYFRAVPGRSASDWLVVVDESHVTMPQIRGMYFGDRARKQTLIDHGFRLPSALDNRPLKFDEFCEISPQTIFVSATPAPWELELTHGIIVEQVIRPTGLVDPPIEVRPARNQVPDLLIECRARAARGERTLVTALTKRLCEELTSYLDAQGLRVRYLHSEIETLERLELLRDLREGAFDVLVGVNLLREGLDLPEVALVCILDADKEGFLRSQSALIQTMGRAARNANATAILYADTMTDSMQRAITEVERRRSKQLAYNALHELTPKTIVKAIRSGIADELAAGRAAKKRMLAKEEEQEEEFEDEEWIGASTPEELAADREQLLDELRQSMLEAAERLEFETAARIRDEVKLVESLPTLTRRAKGTTKPATTGRSTAGKAGTRARKKKWNG